MYKQRSTTQQESIPKLRSKFLWVKSNEKVFWLPILARLLCAQLDIVFDAFSCTPTTMLYNFHLECIAEKSFIQNGVEWNEMNSPSTRAHIFIVTYTKIDGFVDSRQEREKTQSTRTNYGEEQVGKKERNQNIIRTIHDAQCTIHTETTIHVNAFPLAFSFERLKCSFVLCIEVHIFAFSFIVWWFCYFYVLCGVAWSVVAMYIFSAISMRPPCAVIATARQAATDTELQKGWLAGVFPNVRRIETSIKVPRQNG